MSWDKEYSKHKRLWGEGPSELGHAALVYLQKHRPENRDGDCPKNYGPCILGRRFGTVPRATEPPNQSWNRVPDLRALEILDIGCGYGRDALYLCSRLHCAITGIDVSEKALEIAREGAAASNCSNAEFQRLDFKDLGLRQYDVVFASNLYQLLNRSERAEFRKSVERALKPSGLFFMSTLSVSDPEHFGKGVAVPDEPNSFRDEKFLHLCEKEELINDFRFLTMRELHEHKYDEPRSTGETHHHISWILIGERV